MACTTMSLMINFRTWVRILPFAFMLAIAPAFAAAPAAETAGNDASASQVASAPSGVEPIVAKTPMRLEVEDTGVHGQLVVAPEILSPDNQNDLVYTITSEPLYGRVGLAGGEDESDFYKTKTSRVGYFAYQPKQDYAGEDSFSYSVRNETSGLVFKNTVVLTIKPPPPVMLQKLEVEASRMRTMNVREVTLMTRPNKPVIQKVPSHEDFMTPADRTAITGAKVAYLLDDKAKPENGTAKLDRATGQLTYAPNPGFIGQDHFKYYTLDENNPELGVENSVSVNVEPIRKVKHIVADRSRSREVDLVFVINNSPSMAAHQARIAENLSRFRQLFHTRDLDYRIGVLTTDFVPADPDRRPEEQHFYKEVRSVQLDQAGKPVLDRRGRPKEITKRVASNGLLVTLPSMPQPWVTPKTPDSIFSELVKVGTNGDSNRTAFTAVYNFVAGYYNKQHTFLRPDATTIVVFFMDEEETRMALWREQKDGPPKAEWIENGKLPDLLNQYNMRNPGKPQTLDGYINYWVLRPFIIAKGNKRGKIEMDAVVSPNNISHRRAAELTGGTVLNIESDFSPPLAALGDRIADTVAVALEPVDSGATFYKKSLRVLVDGQEVRPDPENGYVYDELTHSIRFQGAAKKKAFAAKIDITYEEHM
ncbi:MAG TPA: Ig-like domain-containing protein [Opitutaceae bacterium]|nr:Ig-like domain-containing protein [Opitutaceae bacterium]